jgi:hypothetical protein
MDSKCLLITIPEDFWDKNVNEINCDSCDQPFSGQIFSYAIDKIGKKFIVRGVFCSLLHSKNYYTTHEYHDPNITNVNTWMNYVCYNTITDLKTTNKRNKEYTLVYEKQYISIENQDSHIESDSYIVEHHESHKKDEFIDLKKNCSTYTLLGPNGETAEYYQNNIKPQICLYEKEVFYSEIFVYAYYFNTLHGDDGLFKVEGCFCSLSCKLAYYKKFNNNQHLNIQDRQLNRLYYGKKTDIVMSPPLCLLRKHTLPGLPIIDIEQFRLIPKHGKRISLDSAPVLPAKQNEEEEEIFPIPIIPFNNKKSHVNLTTLF